jgi:type 1 fimbria pilin
VPNYAGSTIRITAVVKDYDGKPVTTAQSATVTLLDDAGNWVFQNQPLVYDPSGVNADGTTGYWYYDWTTSTSDAGSFQAKATFTGTGYEVYSYGRVSVSPPKVVETGIQGHP